MTLIRTNPESSVLTLYAGSRADMRLLDRLAAALAGDCGVRVTTVLELLERHDRAEARDARDDD